MMIRFKNIASLSSILILSLSLPITAISQFQVNIKAKFAETLLKLSDTIIQDQIKEKSDKDFGAVRCLHCNVLHTRAGESIYPLIISFQITKNEKYLNSALILAEWLLDQQESDGSWKETPEEWTGTTTDQLMMFAKTFPEIQNYLSADKKNEWKKSIRKAADYLMNVMTPEFASINYCATSCASLSETFKIIPETAYLEKAKTLAHRIISKMDTDGFIQGEGGRSLNNKYGVDLGYDLEMSLWGLGIYAANTNDKIVESYVKKSLLNHLYFIYPDGSMDNSWGIRSNKWTIYGGATSDGSQITFMLYADEYPQFAAAAYKNLLSIRESIINGYLGYGPQYQSLFNKPPCIYPTFTKAKNLALAYKISADKKIDLPKIPSDFKNWTKHFETLDVDLVRTNNYMTTISSYRYKDYEKRENSKYMFRPDGGSICNLWVDGYGLLQASSATVYKRWEPMSFPEVGDIISITPRIEFEDSGNYFTNLYEFDSRQVSEKNKDGFIVSAAGELRNQKWLAGGVGYKLTHTFTENSITKEVVLTYHDLFPVIKIVEPFIYSDGMKFERINAKSILIITKKKNFRFDILEGSPEIVTDRNMDKFWSPYPALKAVPIYLDIPIPEDGFKKTVKYKITLLS